MYTGPTGSLPAAAALPPQTPAAQTGWPFRLGLFVLFLACALVIFVLASSYYDIFPTNNDKGFQAGVTAVLLVAALLLKQHGRLKKYWPVAFAFFVASFTQFFSTYFVGWTDEVMRFLRLSDASAQGMAINKVLEACRMVLPILVLVKLSGADLGSLYLKRGNLKFAVLLGLGVLVNYASSVLLFFGTKYTDLDRLGVVMLCGLVFSLANAFMEELWLRGLFQKRLQPLLGGTGTVLLTSLWFALMHAGAVYFMPAAIPIFLVNTFTLGLACGYVMLKTDNLWGATLIHASADFFLFVVTLASP